MTEMWLPVVGWEGLYEVSHVGRVRSVPRTVIRSDGALRRYRGRVLKPKTNRHGYPMVTLANAGVIRTAKVHRLVLEAFVGPQPEGEEACHNNGNRSDSRLENLRWDSHTSNMLDRRGHGTDHQVNKTSCPQGHPYDAENTKRIPSRPTARYCRACHRQRSESRWHLYRKVS